ncbi:MAG TPA: SgcJ/EcaC family oxidoreductase [Gemmataceae bacterium]|nr:SgcJ/EcaC family oxidoreductase [Gemmataceae bacterium]
MMSRKHRTAALVAVAAVGLAGLLIFRPGTPPVEAAGQPAEPKGRAADEAAIRAANQAYAAALASGDLEAVMAFWDADGDYVDESGKVTSGKDNIAALFRKALPELKGSKFTGKVLNLKFLKPDICFEDGTVEITSPTGTKESSRFAAVWSRAGDKWLISSIRDLPAEATDLPSLAAAQLKDLEWLVGEWVDDEAKKDVTMSCKWDTNKAFLLMHYLVKREGQDDFEVTVRVGWDGASGKIRSWTFDSQGGFSEAFWTKDGKRWLVGSTGVLPDGGVGESTLIYEFKDANSFVWRATEREVDGQPLADSEVKYVRKPAAK